MTKRCVLYIIISGPCVLKCWKAKLVTKYINNDAAILFKVYNIQKHVTTIIHV